MPHPDDEILSTLLDGEAPPGDVAHVDGCSPCQERLGQLRYASQLVASVPLPAPHLREASVAAAMRGADRPSPMAAITSLGRRRRYGSDPDQPTQRRTNGLPAAAALLVALAVGGLAISQLGSSSGGSRNQTDNSSVAENLNAASDSAAGGATSGSGAREASSALQAGDDLGEVDDISAVSQRSTADLAGRDTTSDSMPYSSLTCPPATGDEPVLWQARLTYKRARAVATVRSRSSTLRVTEIRALSDCSLLETQEFAPTNRR